MELSVWVRGFLRSAPALKAAPLSSPVKTTQRISGSSSSRGNCSCKPEWNSAHQALRASGRLKVKIPTWPRFSKSKGIGILLSWSRDEIQVTDGGNGTANQI